MCTGIETVLLGGALSLGSSLLAPKPKMPPQELPAVAPAPVKQAGAKVFAGDGSTDEETNNPTSYASQQETRVFGKPVGGLGMSGISI
jgi:hypothetical protein